MTTMIETRAFTKAEFEGVKADLKAIGIKASLRYQTQQYAFGAISIVPRKEAGYLFSIMEVRGLRAYLTGLGVYLPGLADHSDYAFRQGINYVRKLAGE